MAHWLNKILPSIQKINKKKHSIPEGLWRKCPKCDAVLYKPELEKALNVCSKCGHHLRINARKRIEITLDPEGQQELAAEIEPVDKLKFKDSKRYRDRIAQAQRSTEEKDALIVVSGTIESIPVVIAAFDFNFMGGSMGSVVGEKFVQAAEYALQKEVPLICFSASGGARMQEALFSLMQMAKTSAVLQRLKSVGIPYLSVLTDPVYGGVSASIAMLGDLNLAEPNALIGFAGPRVIEQTVRQKLPDGFQRSEFLLDHGAIDRIVPRVEMRSVLATVLCQLGYQLPPISEAIAAMPVKTWEAQPAAVSPDETDAVESSDSDTDTLDVEDNASPATTDPDTGPDAVNSADNNAQSTPVADDQTAPVSQEPS